jgi:RNA polymerase sigma-70 factor (ECF subfamily)
MHVKTFPDENKWIEKLQKGDVEAFDLIYEKYSGRLYLFSLKYLRSTAEAEELVQSVFLKVWENHTSLNKELSFKSYLFTIAYNDICKLYRKRNYHLRFIAGTLSDNLQDSMDGESSLDYKSVLELVYQIVDLLPAKQRIIFLKSRQEGKSTKEIAEEVGLTPGTVDNYISGALKFIRSRLGKESLTVLLFASLFLS